MPAGDVKRPEIANTYGRTCSNQKQKKTRDSSDSSLTEKEKPEKKEKTLTGLEPFLHTAGIIDVLTMDGLGRRGTGPLRLRGGAYIFFFNASTSQRGFNGSFYVFKGLQKAPLGRCWCVLLNKNISDFCLVL